MLFLFHNLKQGALIKVHLKSPCLKAEEVKVQYSKSTLVQRAVLVQVNALPIYLFMLLRLFLSDFGQCTFWGYYKGSYSDPNAPYTV